MLQTRRLIPADGFKAFLNGVPIDEPNASPPAALRWHRGVNGWMETRIRSLAENLRVGRNVLAVHSAWANRNPRDMMFSVALSGREVRPMDTQERVYFDYPTPEKINGHGISELAGKPLVSVPGGVFSAPLRVALSLPEGELGQIYFSVDGSFPDESSNVYREPILISGSTHLRARCYYSQKNPGLVSSEIYSLFDRGNDGRARLASKPEISTRAGVKLRGSSTRDRAKKAFRIETRDEFGDDKNVSLLGMPAGADWILYGPYNYDQSLIRNSLVYELSNQMGRYAVRTRFVEAFVLSDDDSDSVSLTDYVGLYVLMGKIGRSSERLRLKRPGRGGEEDALSWGGVFSQD